MALLDGLRSVFMQSLKFCKNKLAYDFLVERWNKECEEVYKYKQALIAEERAKHTPTADVEEVTYCKDCEWSVKRVRNNDIFPYQCVNTVACGKPRRALDFCSYGMK